MSLKGYFNSWADSLHADAKKAGIFSSRSDIGTERETILVEFLRNHLPSRFVPELGGHVFGRNGAKSGQIDIIVNCDLGLRFTQGAKSFSAVESVATAISVKSKLDKEQLIESLDNLQSIPQLDETMVNLSPLKPRTYPKTSLSSRRVQPI